MDSFIKSFAIGILLLLSMNSFVQGDQKRDMIVKFMQMAQVYERVERSVAAYKDEYQKRVPSLTDEYWKSEIDPILVDYKNEVIDSWVQIYDKYLSKEEIIQIVTFYESQLGKKLLEMNKVLAPKFDKSWIDLASKLNDKLISKLQKDGFYR